MPEYHQIETYVDFAVSLDESLDRCKQVFATLGWTDPSIGRWLDAVSWDVAEDGIVYSGANGPHIQVVVGKQPLDVRLMLLGWTPQIIPRLDSPCIELAILFDTATIQDLSAWPEVRYKANVGLAVWQLMEQLSRQVMDYGVFFTDEAQDGKAWRELVQDDGREPWEFELAIVSQKFKARFLPVAGPYVAREMANQLWLGRLSSWDRMPWEASNPATGASGQ